jgi:HAD superfamily hydrolase (TIGR01509 family)
MTNANAKSPAASVDLVIFDCDGVLIDSEIIACAVEARLLTDIGYPMTTEEVVRRFAGIADRDMISAIEKDWGRPLPEDYRVRRRALIRDACERELRAVPGVADVVGRLSKRICVASSSTPAWLNHTLGLVGLHERFAPNIFSASMVERGKPAPDIFLYAAERMGAAPARCLVIEDSAPGVKAGKAAGMTVFGFVGASHCGPDHGERLRQAGADAIYAEMASLGAALLP